MLAATEPVEARLLAAAASSCRSADVEELCDELADEYEDDGPRLRARAGRRRLPLPDPSRPRALRRAVRARRPARPPVGARAGDARDRRLQAADLARPDLGDPRRQRRGDAAPRSLQRGYVRGGRPRSRARPRGALRHDHARSSNGSASTRSPTCRRSATSSPTRRSSRRSSAACHLHDDPRVDDAATPTPPRPERRRRG